MEARENVAEQNRTQEQDLGQLLKVRREKLFGMQEEGQRSLSDHKIRRDPSQ